MMKRSTSLLAAALVGLSLVGCGGNSTSGDSWTGTDVATNSSGSLSGVKITPTPGSTFISQRSHFRLEWPAPATPPATFKVVLQRYKEARGSEPRVIETQGTQVSKLSETTYDVRRTNDTALDSAGVYILTLTSSDGVVSATYVISSDL